MKSSCSYFALGIFLVLLLLISETKNYIAKTDPKLHHVKTARNKANTQERIGGTANKLKVSLATEPKDVIAHLSHLESALIDPENLVKEDHFKATIKKFSEKIHEKFGFIVISVIVSKLPETYEAKTDHYLSELKDLLVAKFSVNGEKLVLLLTVFHTPKQYLFPGDVDSLHKVVPQEKLSQLLEDVNKKWSTMGKEEDPGKIIASMFEEFYVIFKHSLLLSGQLMIVLIGAGCTLFIVILICLCCCKKKTEEADKEKKAEAEPLNQNDGKGEIKTDAKIEVSKDK